jgi:AcrR family transcriptional regulator
MKDKDEKESLQRIVEAATAEFAEVGYAGARVDAIAKRAGLNKAAIYYHIGGKRELYEYVIQALLSDTADRTIQSVRAASSPEEQLRCYIRGLGQALDRNSGSAPIILREIAASGEHLSVAFFQTLFRLFGTLVNILQEGEEQGVFSPVPPIVVHFMTIGPLVLQRVRGLLLFDNPRRAEFLEIIQAQADDALRQRLPAIMRAVQQGMEGSPGPSITEEIEELIVNAVKT